MVNQSPDAGASPSAPWLSNFFLLLEIVVYYFFNAAFEMFCIGSIATGTQHALKWCGRELSKAHFLPVILSHTREEWESICSFIIGICLAPLVLRWAAGHSIRGDVYYILTLPSKFLSRHGKRNIGPAAPIPTKLAQKTATKTTARRSASPVSQAASSTRVRKR